MNDESLRRGEALLLHLKKCILIYQRSFDRRFSETRSECALSSVRLKVVGEPRMTGFFARPTFM